MKTRKTFPGPRFEERPEGVVPCSGIVRGGDLISPLTATSGKIYGHSVQLLFGKGNGHKINDLKEGIMVYAASTASSKDEKAGTVFAGDLEVQGTVKFKSSLTIEGVFTGEILSEGVLTVGPSAKVTATIRTKTLVSRGEINGDVFAEEQVVLEETAVHNGNITSPGIVIERGSTFNGSCSMKRGTTVGTGSF